MHAALHNILRQASTLASDSSRFKQLRTMHSALSDPGCVVLCHVDTVTCTALHCTALHCTALHSDTNRACLFPCAGPHRVLG